MPLLAAPLAAAASTALYAAGASVATQAIAANAVAVVLSSTAASTVASTALVIGASYALAKLTAPGKPRPSDGSIEFKQPLPARFLTYGKFKTSGPVLFLELNDLDPATDFNYRLLKIVAFGARELATMDPVYVDGTAVTLAAGASGSLATAASMISTAFDCWSMII